MLKLRYILLLSIISSVLGYSTISAQGKSKSKKQAAAIIPASVRLDSKEQQKFDYYFYEAMKAKATSKYDATFDYLQHCLAIDSTNANVLFELGNFYSSLSDTNKAMNYYRKAVEYDNGNFYYTMAYASLCLEMKQYSDAIEQYELMLGQSPDKTDLYLYLSESYRLDGNLPKAIESLDLLEQNIGMIEKISLQKFQLYVALKQEDKGYAEIQKYIDKYPNEIKYQILLGSLYMQADKKDQALKIFNTAREIDPENPYLISSMADYYEQTNNKAAAEQELKTAVLSPKMDIDTKLSILTQYVGTLQANKKDTKTANQLFHTLMQQHPQEPKLNLMYGNLLLLQKEKAEAYDQFHVFAGAHPTNPTGWEQMLTTSFPDSISQTIYTCREAIKYLPEEPQFYFYLGISLFIDQKSEEALSTLKKGIKYVDTNKKALLSDFYGQMGDIHHQMGREDSSFVLYEKALANNPRNIGVLNNYSYYLSLSDSELDKAEKMSALTIQSEPSNPTYLDTYGWVLFKQGAYTMAKIYLEKAIHYSIENEENISSEILEHYADVLFKTGDEEQALEYWIKAKNETDKEDKEDKDNTILNKKIKTKQYIDSKKDEPKK